RLRSCGGTGFRETEIAIDGQPAGVAPIYPWIYTGGIDPYLWRPIPGVQTLNFIPYRVDLTPFAGILSNGQSHSVSLHVYNANHHFATTASLLLFLDHGARQVTGQVTKNSLQENPTPDIQVDINTVEGVTTGTVNIYSSRRFEIEGFVETSHGTVETSIEQVIRFSSEQEFNITSTSFAQNLNQRTRISSRTTSEAENNQERTIPRRFDWPLTLSFSAAPRPDGYTGRTTIIRQEYADRERLSEQGDTLFLREVSSIVTPQDTLIVQGSTAIGREDQASSHQYFSRDSTGACYSRTITAEMGLVSSIVDGERCVDK